MSKPYDLGPLGPLPTDDEMTRRHEAGLKLAMAEFERQRTALEENVDVLVTRRLQRAVKVLRAGISSSSELPEWGPGIGDTEDILRVAEMLERAERPAKGDSR